MGRLAQKCSNRLPTHMNPEPSTWESNSPTPSPGPPYPPPAPLSGLHPFGLAWCWSWTELIIIQMQTRWRNRLWRPSRAPGPPATLGGRPAGAVQVVGGKSWVGRVCGGGHSGLQRRRIIMAITTAVKKNKKQLFTMDLLSHSAPHIAR